jgi:hypothetical protein
MIDICFIIILFLYFRIFFAEAPAGFSPNAKQRKPAETRFERPAGIFCGVTWRGVFPVLKERWSEELVGGSGDGSGWCVESFRIGQIANSAPTKQSNSLPLAALSHAQPRTHTESVFGRIASGVRAG